MHGGWSPTRRRARANRPASRAVPHQVREHVPQLHARHRRRPESPAAVNPRTAADRWATIADRSRARPMPRPPARVRCASCTPVPDIAPKGTRWVRRIDQNAAMGRGLRVAVAVLVVATAAACADDDDSADSATARTTVAAAATSTSPRPPARRRPPPPCRRRPRPRRCHRRHRRAPPTTEPPGPQWTETPVEGARLLRRQPLTIYERVADPTKVVLYFEGGGACFSAATCDPNAVTDLHRQPQRRHDEHVGAAGRLLRHVQHGEPARHPFVRVRAVLHRRRARGSITKDYGNGVVIEHRGYANATKALDYLVAQYPDAEQVVVTGESAGSVPTALFGALVADRLPDAGVVTFGDSSRRLPRRRSDQRRHRRGVGLPGGVPDWPELVGLTVEQWSFPEQFIYSGHHAACVRTLRPCLRPGAGAVRRAGWRPRRRAGDADRRQRATDRERRRAARHLCRTG